jgi:Asp-tRNA(Asn)/Glu-tRNA(Gln) amidotransferase A subunit family amidase
VDFGVIPKVDYPLGPDMLSVHRPRFLQSGRLALVCLIGFAAARPVGGQAGRSDAPAPRAAFDVMEKTIEDLQRAMTSGGVTSRQLVDLYLARIEAYDKQGPTLNAIAALNPRAREAADALDAERKSRGPRGPLHGIPILVKDNYETIEMPTAAGSIALATSHPARDAFLVQRLKAAGAVILGKTNMHELAAGITTVGSAFGQTKNPYDLDRNPGGSSGGTGAATAANFAAAAMGSDTCGSIRIPASAASLVGLRGTQGLSSRRGIVPLSSTQDIGGPLARSIADLAILLDATVGADSGDASTAAGAGRIPASYRAALRSGAVKGARLGVVRSLFGTDADDREVTRIVQQALDGLKQAGADVADVVIPGLDDLLRDSSMINSDFKFDLADYLATVPDAPVTSLGEILDRGLYHVALEGTFRTRNAVPSRETEVSRRARIKRAAIRQAVDAVMLEHRLVALVYPTLRRRPSRIGEPQAGTTCQLSAHSGLPALALPAGFTTDEVPIGVELLGAAFSEQDLLSLGFGIEQTLKTRRPPFSTPALVNGRAPVAKTMAATLDYRPVGSRETGLTAELRLAYDATTSRLQYALGVAPAGRDRLAAVWIHAGTVEKPGAARHQLLGGGRSTEGTVTLSAADRKDLSEGRLLVRFFVRGVRGSAGDVSVSFPR